MCLCINSQAADIFVNSSGQAGSYPTLAGALAAANNGDRILVSSIITLTETDTINKSVTINSTAPGSSFELIGDLYVEAIAGMEVRIIGLSLNGKITALAGTATELNRCQLYIVDSEILNGDINCDVAGLGLNVFYSKIEENAILFRYGKLIANEIGGFYIKPGDGINYNDTTFIIANKINDAPNSNWILDSIRILYNNSYYENWQIYAENIVDNNDHFFFISNNFFSFSPISTKTRLAIIKNNVSSNGGNVIQNNSMFNEHSISSAYKALYHGSCITFHYVYSHANTKIINNVFSSNGYGHLLSLFGTGYGSGINNSRIYTMPSNYKPNYIGYNLFGASPSSLITNSWSPIYIPNTLFTIDQTNYYSGSNNGFTATVYFNSSTGKATSGVAINAGANLVDYYDIDMTRNDIGTYGGPYSWDNYWNTASGSARIYNLDLPFEVWSGQPNVKADAVHQK